MSVASPLQSGPVGARRVLIVWLAFALLATCGLAACGGDGDTDTSAREPTADVSRPQGLLEWIAGHPDNAAMVVLRDRDEALIEQNALDLAVAPREESFEPPGAKPGGQRFDANASP